MARQVYAPKTPYEFWRENKTYDRAPTPERDRWITEYLDILGGWRIRLDHEDGSSAPFSTLAAEANG